MSSNPSTPSQDGVLFINAPADSQTPSAEIAPSEDAKQQQIDKVENSGLAADTFFTAFYGGFGAFIDVLDQRANEVANEAAKLAEKELPILAEVIPGALVLEYAAIPVGMVITGGEIFAGASPPKAVSSYISGLAGGLQGKLVGQVISKAADLTAVEAAITETLFQVGGVAGAIYLTRILYDSANTYFSQHPEALQITPGDLEITLKQYMSGAQSVISNAFAPFTAAGLDITTSQGLTNWQTISNNVVMGLKTEVQNAITELLNDAGIGSAVMGDFDAQIAQAQSVFDNALSQTSTALQGGSQTNAGTLLASYVLGDDSGLDLDVQSGLQGTQAQVGTADTLANGLIVTDNADGSATYAVTNPNNAPTVSSFTQTQDDTGSVISTETEYTDGTSEYTLVDPDDGSTRTVDYSGANGTGTVTRVDEEYSDGTSEIILVSNNVATTTSYSQANGVGTATVESVAYELPETNAGVTNPELPSNLTVTPTSFSSIASAIGLGSTIGAVTIAAMNGSVNPSALEQGAEAYVPAAVGTSQPLPLPVPAPPNGDNPSSASQTWTFSTGGILVLDAIGGSSSFTPLTFSGTDDPQNAIYVMNPTGQLMGILQESQSAEITATVTLNYEYTVGSTYYEFDVAPVTEGYGDSASYTVFDQNSQQQNQFGPPSNGAALPFFDASSATTSANAFVETILIPNGGYAQLATFNTNDDTPDLNWTFGVDSKGDAVVTGNSETGYDSTVVLTQGESNGTGGYDSDITAIELGQQTYGLYVIPQGGLHGGFSTIPVAPQSVIAEGTGTSTIQLQDENYYWHVTGKNDQITLDYGSTDQFYFSGNANAYTESWNGNGTLTVSGGSTGKTTFTLNGGNGEIDFADGTSIGLGEQGADATGDTAFYAGEGSDVTFTGGTQTIEAGLNSSQPNSGVDFETGDDIPDLNWSITESTNPNKADANKLLVTFDGTNAGYDGVATLGGISEVTLDDLYYQLEALTKNGTLTLTNQTSQDGYLVVDEGGAKLDFASTSNSYWHVGGTKDSATLGISSQAGYGGVTDIYFAGAQSQYTIKKSAKSVTISGGTTGTTKITLAGGSGNLIFGDGSTLAIGAVQGAMEAELHLHTQVALLNQAIATNHAGNGAFTATAINALADTPHALLAPALHG